VFASGGVDVSPLAVDGAAHNATIRRNRLIVAPVKRSLVAYDQ
jgi:hypothetical protein